MPDLQNLGWSTKLRKLFTESHCVNCYVSSLWKVASYSTMAPSFLVGSKDQCLGILEILPIKRRGKRRNHRWSFVWKIRGNTSQQRWRCYPPLLSQRKRERRPLLDFRFQWKFEGSLVNSPSRIFRGGSPAWMAIPTDVVSHTDLRGRRRNVEMSPRALEVEKNCFRLFSKMASQRGLVTSFTCLIQVSCWPSKRANLFPPKNQSSAPSSQKYVSPIDAKGIPTQRWWHGDTTLAKLIACGKWHLLTPLERLLWGAKTVTWEFEMSPVWLQRHIKRSHMNHQ